MDHFWQEISDNTYSDNARIQVYQTNFQATKLKALDENFALTKSIMGDATFTAISKHFIHNIASVNDSLNLYGKEFPDFLNEIIPYNPGLLEKAYLVDTAHFDWAVMQSYFAMNDEPSISWSLTSSGEHAYLHIARHVEYVCFEHFFGAQFYSANQTEQTLFTSQEFSLRFTELISTEAVLTQRQPLLIYRKEFEVHVMTLSPAEDAFFLLLRERTPLFFLEEQLAHIASPDMINNMMVKFKNAGILIGITESDHD